MSQTTTQTTDRRTQHCSIRATVIRSANNRHLSVSYTATTHINRKQF